MITQADITKITNIVATKTRNASIAEDAVQDAVVMILDRGEELTPARVHSYAKYKALENVRHEDMEHRKLADYSEILATNRGEPLFTMAPGVVPCEACGTPFKQRRNNGQLTRACCNKCGYVVRSKDHMNKRKRGTHIARSN